MCRLKVLCGELDVVLIETYDLHARQRLLALACVSDKFLSQRELYVVHAFQFDIEDLISCFNDDLHGDALGLIVDAEAGNVEVPFSIKIPSILFVHGFRDGEVELVHD